MKDKRLDTQKLKEDIEFVNPLRIFPNYSLSRAYLEPPAKRDWKDISEIVKNVASVIALIAAGVWTVYQWDTIFPKTISEVKIAAAAVRTDVTGSLKVEVGFPDMDPGEIPATPDTNQTKPTATPTEFCEANQGGAMVKTSPVSGQIFINSASGIPVLAKVENIQFELRKLSDQALVGSAAPVEGAIRVVAQTTKTSIDDDQIFFGGLRENRIEKGQAVKIAFLFDADIPIPCNQSLGALVIFRTSVVLQAINPVTSEIVADQVRKVFISACQVDLRSGAHCNIETLEAYGQ